MRLADRRLRRRWQRENGRRDKQLHSRWWGGRYAVCHELLQWDGGQRKHLLLQPIGLGDDLGKLLPGLRHRAGQWLHPFWWNRRYAQQHVVLQRIGCFGEHLVLEPCGLWHHLEDLHSDLPVRKDLHAGLTEGPAWLRRSFISDPAAGRPPPCS